MNHTKKKTIWMILLICISLVGCGKREYYLEDVVEEGEFHTIYRNSDGTFLYEIYDSDGKVVWRDIVYSQPTISIYDARYIEVKWGAGTGVWLGKYYDSETRFLTQALECARYVGEGRVDTSIVAPSTYEELEALTQLTRKEALDSVFDYLYAGEDYLVDVTFYETEEAIGYKWKTDDNMTNPMYLTQRGFNTNARGDIYCFVRLASDLYDSTGTSYTRTETWNEFAVNMNTGEIIEMRVYHEDGTWSVSEEYQEKIWERR